MFIIFRNKKTQNHLSKVYAALGSGIVFSFFSGVIASHGYLPYGLIGFLFVASIIVDIVCVFMDRNNKLNTYLKPASFYTYALCMGGLIGNLFLLVTNSEKKL